MILTNWFRSDYHNLNTITIDSSSIYHNYTYLSSLQKSLQIALVLKSNAYGHGLVKIAKILDKVKAPFFCVDSLFEGYELLKAGIKTKILIMGYTNPLNLTIKKLSFSFAVYDLETAKALNKYQPNCQIHVFVDTGMNREGVKIEDLPEFLKEVRKMKNLMISGLMSHLAMAGKLNHELTEKQLEVFAKAKKMSRNLGIKPDFFHIASSSALLTDNDKRNNLGNLARVGQAIYGIDILKQNENLHPALKMTATITQIKKVGKNEFIGYDFSYKTRKEMTIGILSAGYNDGIDRRLSGKGGVYIKDVFCPYAGKISMNLSAVDVSMISNPQVGDKAVIYSAEEKKKNSIKKTAKICKTIPYEILIHLNKEIKRVVV